VLSLILAAILVIGFAVYSKRSHKRLDIAPAERQIEKARSQNQVRRSSATHFGISSRLASSVERLQHHVAKRFRIVGGATVW